MRSSEISHKTLIRSTALVAAMAGTLLAACATGLRAGDGAGLAKAGTPPQESGSPIEFVSAHAGTFNGEQVRYRAEFSELQTPATDTLPRMRFVSTAYLRTDIVAAGRRPVIFLFNGGPSVPSSWLHMGAFGPYRITVPLDVAAEIPRSQPPVENPFTVLDVADLVFVDPPETGFSRVLDEGRRDAVYSTEGDAQAVALFVKAWLAKQGRSDSPVYLLGESYGTIRAALMAGLLAESVRLEGIILFGQAVNIVETVQRAQNAMAYATNLSALTAIAAYHGRIETGGRSLEELIDAAHEFGMGRYLQALVRGNGLSEAERRAVAEELSRLTGIGAEYYLAHGLVISKVAFRSELLRDEGRVLAGNDARYTGPAPGDGEQAADPFAGVSGLIAPALRSHLGDRLGVTLDMEDYRGFAPGAGNWAWPAQGGFPIGGPFSDYYYDGVIQHAMEANPRFRLMVATGIFDLLTTVGPARYLAAQAGYPPERIVLREYFGGHMAYTHEPTLEAFTNDVRNFVAGPERRSAPRAD